MPRRIIRISIFAAVLLLTLSLVDATITSINISRYGMGVEWNPLMRHLIETYGVWIMFVAKSFFGCLLIFMLVKTEECTLRKWVIPTMFWLIGVYTVIVFYGYCLLIA